MKPETLRARRRVRRSNLHGTKKHHHQVSRSFILINILAASREWTRRGVYLRFAPLWHSFYGWNIINMYVFNNDFASSGEIRVLLKRQIHNRPFVGVRGNEGN